MPKHLSNAGLQQKEVGMSTVLKTRPDWPVQPVEPGLGTNLVW